MKTLIPFLALAQSAATAVALDLDSNGYPDVWEARYHATGLVPASDFDSDGQTNLAESQAGTDPRNSASVFRSTIENQSLIVTTEAGKKYRLLVSRSTDGPWKPSGGPVIGTGSPHAFSIAKTNGREFFMVSVEDNDADLDGVPDWDERQLSGFNPSSATSFSAAGSNDLAIASQIINAWKNAIAVDVTAGSAFEKENEPAILTYSRAAASAYPLTLFLTTSGATNPAKSSASAGDFLLEDAAGQPVSRMLVIPAGSASAVLRIKPVADTTAEVPEQLSVSLGGGTTSTGVFIRDAMNTTANQKLLIAYLHPVDGVASKGGGLSTIRLQGDNDAAVITVSFSNLNSAVTSTQVLTSSSSILKSVPASAYTGLTWEIRASQSFLTDQAVLDSLLSGDVKLGVFTATQPTGEIEGPFQPVDGSIEFVEPPPPDPIAALTGNELDRDIVRFLTQATYGPTPESIADLKARVVNAGGDRITAYSQWIDEQFSGPAVSMLPYVMAANRQEIELYADPTKPYYRPTGFDPVNSNRRRAWWLLALNAPDQLRQRLAFALSQIFVISDTDTVVNNRSYGAATYYDMLRTSCDGPFQTLLEDVSRNPMMGHYLSHRANSKATYSSTGLLLTSPDENYAREIMQLFSIGLVQLHPDGSLKLDATGSPIPTYGQADITEMARVFTGWSFSKRNSPSNSDTVIDNTTFTYGYGTARYEAQWINPMKQFPDRHDTGAKSMIGLSLPAGQTGEKDLTDVVAYLTNHPNTASFISRRLIQRLVSANPSRGYLYRVSNAFSNSGGDLGDTVKAILLDPEARSVSDAASIASFGKAREPILKSVAWFRAFNLKSKLLLSDLLAFGYPQSELDKFPMGTTRARMPSTTAPLGQTPMAPPTVFNWFLPDYSPPGILATNGLYSPELQLANESSVVSAVNFLYNPIYSSNGYSSTSNLPNQTEAPYNYTTTAHYLIGDYTSLEALYMAVVDVNGDGLFNSLDTTTFNNPAAITTACTAVLDRIDLVACAGNLKARYGDATGKPRKLILDAVVGTRAVSNATNNAASQKVYMQDRIKAALWLVMASPEFVTQK